MGRLILALCLLAFTSRARCQICGALCRSVLYEDLQQYTSPCYPSPYTNNVNCKNNFTVSGNTNYTMITISSFATEAWHDYLKFGGATNFVIFADVDKNEISVTGYPSANITTEFVSDGSVVEDGFNATVQEISENDLVIQYADYKNTSNVQVLDSPLYVTSVDNVGGGTTLDLILMNIPNDTTKPAESWAEYVDLMFNSTPIEVSELSPGNINVSWTLIGGTKEYVITVENSKGVEQNETTVDGTKSGILIDSLPHGSILNVTVKAEDKLGVTSETTKSVKTSVSDPTTFSVVTANEKNMTLTWTLVNGATEYVISGSTVLDDTGLDRVGNKSATAPPLILAGLYAGYVYNVSLYTIFEEGESGPYTIQHVTRPSAVENIKVTNIHTKNFTVTWDGQRGVEHYNLKLMHKGSVVSQTQEPKTEHTFTELEPGRKYEVVIQSVNDAGKSGEVLEEFTTEILPNDARVWTSGIKSKEFVVEWTQIPGAVNYTLVVIPAVSGEVKNFPLSASELKKTVIDLRPGMKYNISLEVAGENKIDFLRTEITTGTEKMNLSATDIKTDGFNLTWNLLDGAISYQVWVNSSLNFTVPPVNSYRVFDGLESGTNYSVEAFAVFNHETGAITNKTVSTAPTAVINVAVDDIGVNWFVLSWTSSKGATSYDVDVKSGSGKTINFPDTSSGMKLTNGIEPGMLYSVIIYALNGESRSDGVNEEIITDLGPTTLSFVGVSRNHFTLKWEKVDGAKEYQYKCHDHNNKNTTELSAKISGLEPEKRYDCSITPFSDYKKGKTIKNSTTTVRDLCASSPCQNGGRCTSDDVKYTCACPDGFNKDRNCEPIDYCKDKEGNAVCGENADCKNKPEQQTHKCECKAGYTGNAEAGCVAFCEQKTINGFTFRFTYGGITAFSEQNCGGQSGNEARPEASIVCQLKANGATFDTTSLTNVSCETKVDDLKLDDTDVTSTTEVEKKSKDLELLTTGTNLTKDETEDIADYIERVNDQGEESQQGVTEATLRGLVNTASNLLESSEYFAPQKTDGDKDSQKSDTREEKEVKKKILKNLNSLAEQVQIPENKTEIIIDTVAMVVKVLVRENKTDAFFEPVIVKNTNNAENTSDTYNPVRIDIPSDTIDIAEEKQKKIGGNKTRISFFLHKDATLFPIDDSNEQAEMIISANLGTKEPLQNLAENENIKYHYRETKEKLGVRKDPNNELKVITHKFTCQYWDETAGRWSKEGCCAVPPNLTQCRCNHLTNFAVIVTKTTLPAMHSLETFTTVGLVLSLVGLVLTIIIHCLKEDVRKRGPTRILLHICGNLIVAYIIFMAGIEKTENKTTCTVITAFLQYFFLTSWCWMTVYASDMYRGLVLVFKGSKTRYLTKCSVFGYGVPLLITVINLGVTVGYADRQKEWNICPGSPEKDVQKTKDEFPMESEYVSPNMCWLHDYSLLIGFLLPIGLMVIFNLFVYGMVMKTILGRAKSVQSSMKKTDWKDNFMISVTVTASTGLTWIFGFLMLVSEDTTYLTVTSWIFAIFNTLQGVLIFFATCVRHENMRKIWWAPIRKSCARLAMRLSPNRQEYNIDSDTGASTYFSTGSTSQTKDTTLSATKIREITSETNL